MRYELSDVVDAIPALVWTVRSDGHADFLNQRWCDYTGLSLEEARGAGWQAAIYKTDLPVVLDHCRARQATCVPRAIEAGMRRFDGTHRRLLMHGSPFRDESGAIVGRCWYVSHTDLEEQKRTDALLAGEKQVLEMVARGRPLPTILDAVCAVVEAAAPGCHCSIMLIDQSGTRFQRGAGPTLPSGFLDAVDGGAVTYESGPCGMAASLNTQVIVPDVTSDAWWNAEGWPPWVLAHGFRSWWSTPILSLAGTVLGTLALYREAPGRPTVPHQALIEQFTHVASIAIERTQAEAALRRSEAFLAEAQRLSSTGSFAWHATTGGTTWSDQTYRIFEIDRGTPLTSELVHSRIHPDDVAMFDAMVDRARRDGNGLDVEHRLRMPDSSIKYVRVVAHATRDDTGQLEYIGAVQDVTERRLAEDTLDKVRSELAHVARVTTLGVLTASIAHEVNQPLSGIMTNASTCLRMLAEDPPNVDGARETARRAMRDAQRGADVIAKLRGLFAKRDTATESVDLNEATREVIALSNSELQRARVLVRTELADDLPPVTGDRVQLQQVVLNLLLNASEAMRGVDDRPRQLVIRTELDDEDGVRLSVQDAGVGVDPQNVERLFDAFYTTKSGGMGIGLSVSRSIIARHHGHLRAAQNDGPGATFAFSLPAVGGVDANGSSGSRDSTACPEIL
jgi:PAS domain S-box-containing protein